MSLTYLIVEKRFNKLQ